MENCRVETTTRRDVLCQPTVNGRAEGDPWVIARNIGADSLSWDHGLLILDDEFGTVYRIQETGDDAARALDLSSLIESGSSDRIRLSMHSHIGKDNSPLTAERQAIIDKQKEAFPRAFEESDAETPQAARAFNGAAARAARRNRKRPKSEK